MDLRQALDQLDEEHIVLRKLLHRNNNQHGKTKLHKYLAKMSQCLSDIPSSSMLQLHKSTDTSLRSLQKPSTAPITSCLTTLEMGYCLVASIANTAHWCTLAAKESGASINQKVFLPLFTIYMAIEARVHRLLLELLHSFHAKSVALNDALQHCAIAFPKHAATITAATQVLYFNPMVLKYLQLAAPPVAIDAEDFGEMVDDSIPTVSSVPKKSRISSAPDLSKDTVPTSVPPAIKAISPFTVKPTVNLFGDIPSEVLPVEEKQKKRRSLNVDGTPVRKKKRSSVSQHRGDIDDIFKGI